MNICHLVFRADPLTYTVARALTHAGHDLFVWVVDPEHGSRVPGNIQKLLSSMPRVRIVARDEDALPATIDRLIVQVFPRPAESIRDFGRLAGRAHRITVITAGDRSRTWREAMKAQWLEARTFARRAGKIDRVAYKDGFHPFDLHGLFKSRRVVGFDVHSKFLDSQQAFGAIHARDWDPESRRPILCSFLGSQDPDARRRILDGVRHQFVAKGGDSGTGPAGKPMYWHEYSDAVPAPLAPEAFLDVLTNSDFSLCPRGYSLVTHRPMEALLRGSIPVVAIDELDLYDVGLEDGVNCIGVPAGRWPEAVERLGNINEDEIIRMRRNINAMQGDRLSYDAVSEQIRARLGLRASAPRPAQEPASLTS